ncbi:MAG: amidohydrolase [Deferribacteraceae bacterium]|jgi:aminobenzoyl-glutamate utilization protein A|nr:amidohydrolase [Deferribacteraceae bacterium]
MLAYIGSKVKELEKKIIGCRRDLHKHAEPGWTEFRTAAMAITELQKLGYTIKMGEEVCKRSAMMGVPPAAELKAQQERAIAQGANPELIKKMDGITGFTAEMKFSDGGPVMGFRVDMDSNDANESKDSDHKPAKEGFASINAGAMHACGHDAHVAVGLAVAEIVASMKDKLKGSVRFIFQPAEEGLRGAGPMVAAGVTKGLNYILGMHVGFQADKKGSLVCGAKGFLASTKWDVTITGLSAHAGAAPQEGHNALLAAAVAAINLHAISRHGDGVTRINVGKMIAGEGRNVVPPNAFMVMETRGATSELNNYMAGEAGRVIKAACDMYQCSHSIEVTGGTQSGESSEEMIEIVYEAAKELPEYTDITKMKDFGAGEDYAHMMSEVQKDGGIGTYVQVGVTRMAGHHNSKFDIDEADLLPAAKLMSYVIYKVLRK